LDVNATLQLPPFRISSVANRDAFSSSAVDFSDALKNKTQKSELEKQKFNNAITGINSLD